MRLIIETKQENWTEVCEKLCEQSKEGEWRVPKANAGLDIPIGETVTIPPGQKAFKIHLGVKVQPNHHYWLVARSSISKTPLRMSNSIGIIDISYRGELIFVVDNTSMQPYVLKKGRRICQIVAMLGSQIYFEFGKVDITNRGSGGFGSTGTGIAPPKVNVL